MTQAAVIVTLDAAPATLTVTTPERTTRQLPGHRPVVLRFGAGDPVVLTAAPFALPLTAPVVRRWGTRWS